MRASRPCHDEREDMIAWGNKSERDKGQGAGRELVVGVWGGSPFFVYCIC